MGKKQINCHRNTIEVVLFHQRMWHPRVEFEIIWSRFLVAVEISMVLLLEITSVKCTIGSRASSSNSKYCPDSCWSFSLKITDEICKNTWWLSEKLKYDPKLIFWIVFCRSSNGHTFPELIKRNMAKVQLLFLYLCGIYFWAKRHHSTTSDTQLNHVRFQSRNHYKSAPKQT